MKSIAIITARGGSKRIPRKNVKVFMGKPMVAYAIAAYNAGGQAVRDVGGCPDNGETYEYVLAVAEAYNGMLAQYG